MRLIPLLLLATALVLAGCAKKADDSGGTPSTTPTTTTTSGGTTTTSPTTTTPSGTTPTTPTDNNSTGGGTTPLAPKDLKSGSVTFPDGCSTAGQPAACPSIAFTVDPGYTTLNLTVAWTCTVSPPCASNGASITVGSLSCPAPQSIDPVNGPPKACTKTGAAASGKITAVPDAAGMTATYKLSEM